jgi:hypothetical protein
MNSRLPSVSWLTAALLVAALSATALADPSYIYGFHDPGGEGYMGSNKGWLVFTEAIGHNPNDSYGGNYSSYSSQGYGVVVRLNNGYGADGTIPYQTYYQAFADRCARFVQNSSGVDYWIIANEMNGLREWPGNNDSDPAVGEPITVARYTDCYNRCWTAIKAVAPTAKLVPGAIGTWGPPFSAQNIEGFMDYWTNMLNSIGASKIDGLAIHTYTHGCDPALITDLGKMGPPYQNIYYNFQVYRQYMAGIPTSMNTKPVLITECDQNVECADGANPKHAWSNNNNGWVRGVYAEINSWNLANAQKIRCLALFRWPMAQEGAYTFGIQDRSQIIADFQQAVAYNYRWSSTPPSAPTGLTATAGDSQVALSWNTVADAATYNVKRSTTSGGPYTTVQAGVGGTSYTNTGLTNGTTYYYVVSAVNASGESANSSQVGATPNGLMNGNTPTGINAARTATAWATDSNFTVDYGGDKAIDGIITTVSKWTSAGTAPPHWLALDLGASKTVNGFIVRHQSAAADASYYNTKYFKFQSGTSISGPWTDECTVDNSAQAAVTTRSYITPKTLRYVRLYITDAGIDYYARIPEFEVYSPAPTVPTINRSPATLSASCTQGGNPTSQTFTISNSGGGTLSYTISDNVAWLSCSPTTGTSTGETDTITVTYAASSLAAGTYNGTITITDPNATNNPQTIAVTLTVSPPASLISEDFETAPSWSSTYDAAWGNAATWSIVSGGQSGNALQAQRTGTGSSAKAKVYTVVANTTYTVSLWIRCPSSSTYWAETAYKLGSNTAQDFDANGGTWTMIQKFSNDTTNGNGDTWTRYSASVSTGSNTQLTIGFKLGSSSGNGPVVKWDMLRIAPPGAQPTIARSPAALAPSCNAGSNATSQSFTVQNTGAGTLSYSISVNQTWLAVTPTTGTSTGDIDTITVNYATTALTAGTYNATITITDANATNNPQTIAVTLTVNSASKLTVSEDFTSMPSWSSTFDAAWGNAATWSVVGGGQSGNALQAVRTGTGSSAKAKVYAISASNSYTASTWIKCPSGSSYWAECAYKLGGNTAQDFDANGSTWTMIKKFASDGTNGNGSVWTQYSSSFNSGTSTQISVGFKLGSSSGNGPTVQWDTLRVQ